MLIALQGDLEGLKVAHDFEEMGEGEDRILTLKDSRILDNEGTWLQLDWMLVSSTMITLEDELQNVEMAEDERVQKNKELKIKKADYTGYDDDEFLPGNQGLMKKAVLSKYDEFLEGPKEIVRIGSFSVFTLTHYRSGFPVRQLYSDEKEEQVRRTGRVVLGLRQEVTSLH